MPRRRSLTVLGGAGLVLAAAATAGAQTIDDAPLLAPRLVHYQMKCHASGAAGCRIDCYQNGVSVISRLNVRPADELRLVVNAGISDVIKPRWIEIRGAGGGDVETVLLNEDILCDFQAISIEPLESQ